MVLCQSVGEYGQQMAGGRQPGPRLQRCEGLESWLMSWSIRYRWKKCIKSVFRSWDYSFNKRNKSGHNSHRSGGSVALFGTIFFFGAFFKVAQHALHPGESHAAQSDKIATTSPSRGDGGLPSWEQFLWNPFLFFLLFRDLLRHSMALHPLESPVAQSDKVRKSRSS